MEEAAFTGNEFFLSHCNTELPAGFSVWKLSNDKTFLIFKNIPILEFTALEIPLEIVILKSSYRLHHGNYLLFIEEGLRIHIGPLFSQ